MGKLSMVMFDLSGTTVFDDTGVRDCLYQAAQEFKLPKLDLTKPLKVGGNFKVINAEGESGAGFGIGLDGGVRF